MSSRADKNVRIVHLSWFVVGLFTVTGFSQVHTQVIRRGEIMRLAKDSNRWVVERRDIARRGVITSADGVVLAQSEDSFELSLDLRNVPRTAGFAVALSEAAGVSAGEITDAVQRGIKRLAWSTLLGPTQAAKVEKVRMDWRANGVSLRRTTARTYPLAESASTLIGSMPDNVPSGGLESSFNKTLSGQNGLRKGLVDRTGAFLPMRMADGSTARKDGANLQLTLVAAIQQEATRALRTAVESNNATGGAAVVIDPKTGDLLAVANWPSYDPALRAVSGASQAYSFVYEPGSTFKILTLSKALDTGTLGEHEITDCPGEWHLGPGARVRCDSHHGHRAHGAVDPETAIAKSCNIAAAKWSVGVGRDAMIQFIQRCGLLSKTNAGFDHERAGLFDYKEYAKRLQTANVGFGQSISVTPVALASAFSMIGNHGVRMQPRLIKAMDGKEIPIAKGTTIVKRDTADSVLHLMESVIQSDIGTGAKLRIPGYRLAGKTGTAQKIGDGDGYVSSFVGFVPSTDPVAMVLVMVDNPKAGKIYGASVAGPVFRQLATSIIRVYNVPPAE